LSARQRLHRRFFNHGWQTLGAEAMYTRLLLRRFVMVAAVIWAAGTLNFFIPRIAPKNPIAEKLTQMAGTSGVDPSKIKEMADAFSAKFGLDRPLWEQYLHYLRDVFTLDFGQSITHYPARVGELIGAAMPWTLGLMVTTTLISFAFGTLLGAAAAWKRDSRILQVLSPLMMVFSAIPFYFIGLVLNLFSRSEDGVVSALGRLRHRLDSRMVLGLRFRGSLSLCPAGALHHYRIGRHLGHRHAGHDGHGAG
jgi:ABC-type dipeptide/oligopeptide/nickel transport system permease component